MIFIIILGLGTIVTLLIGMPIAFSLGVAGSISVLTMGVPLEIIPMKICYGLNNFPLLCVPFFILAGEFMAHGKITEVLLKFAVTLIGFVGKSYQWESYFSKVFWITFMISLYCVFTCLIIVYCSSIKQDYTQRACFLVKGKT